MGRKATTAPRVPKILAQSIEHRATTSLIPYPWNPRIGDVAGIKESIIENDFVDPLCVQQSTNYILGGNHTWKACVELGMDTVPCVVIDVDDKKAKRLVLAFNRLNDRATYNSDILADVLASLDSPIGTGYSQEDYDALVKAVATDNVKGIEEVINPPVAITRLDPADEAAYTRLSPVPTIDASDAVFAPPTPDDDDELLNSVDPNLQGLLQLSEDVQFSGSNYYGIPDLNPHGLLDKLPTPLDTWGGADATPDDGVTHWLWNYGVASRRDLPADRAILCFYTYDHYFEGWWDNPAFMTAKVINLGIKTVVVPDFSFYEEFATALHIYNVYRAQWLGRYFQEAGLKVIPRLQFATGDGGKSLDFCLAGIPKNPPVLAMSIQNDNDAKQVQESLDGIRKCLTILQPQQWLVYGGNPAKRQIEALDPVRTGLCGEVVHVYNYAHKRRGVVYDKKEGLARVKKRDQRDPHYAPPEAPETPVEAPQTARRVRRAPRQPEPVLDA